MTVTCDLSHISPHVQMKINTDAVQ